MVVVLIPYRDVVANTQNYDIVVGEFELQSHSFGLIPLERCEPTYFSDYILNSTTSVFLQEYSWH